MEKKVKLVMAMVALLLLLISATIMHAQELAKANILPPSQETQTTASNRTTEIPLEELLKRKHVQKSYVSDEGDIYWNKSVPVYISLLTSPNASEGIVIKADPKAEVAPYYFDTEGTNFIRTRWEVDPVTKEAIYPKKEVLWPVIADGMPPKTSISFEGTGSHTREGVAYFSGDVTISLHATDATSGVESIFYSLGGEFIRYNDPIAIETEDEWELRFYAVDRVGNFSVPASSDRSDVNFVVDKTAPVSKFEVVGPQLEKIVSPRAFFRLSAQDEKSGVKEIRYSLSGDQMATYTNQIALSGLSDGDHRLSFFGEDQVANKEQRNEYDFYLDKTSPEVSLSVIGDQFETDARRLFVSERSKLSLTAVDNKAGVAKIMAQHDVSEFNTFEVPIPADSNEGVHVVKYYAVDKVENVSKTSTAYYTVDKTAPTIDYTVTGPKHMRHDTLFVRKTSDFVVKATDQGANQSGVKSTTYKIGSAPESEYKGAFQVPTMGITTLLLTATDQVNNGATQTHHVFVDDVAPEISHTFSVDKIGEKTVRGERYTIFPVDLQVYLAANDKHVGNHRILYRIGNGPEKPYTTPISGFKAGTNVELFVKAVDLLGNESTAKVSFSVE